jgi:polyisoprenoid-binding protein YceI
VKGFAYLLRTFPFLLASCLFAQNQTLIVDPGTSQIAFVLGATGHDVHGNFHVQSASIDFDRSAATISGTVVVAAGSAETGDATRDRKMLTDVLEVASFPQVTFVPERYEGEVAVSGDSQLQVYGVFTLHGTPHNITVPVRVHIEGQSLTAKAHITVPYVQWGLKDPSVFILKVAKEVGVDVTLSGRITR